MEVEGKPGVPVYRTKTTDLVSRQGRLLFNADLPDSIDQTPLFPGDDGDDDDDGE